MIQFHKRRKKQREEIKKKNDDAMTVVMDKNPDILKTLGQQKQQQVLIGFAAETQNLIENATEKVNKKNLDMIVANDVSAAGAGFNTDTNIVKFLYADGRLEALDIMPKTEVAKDIIDNHIFHPWEGGEGKVPAQYQFSRVQLALKAISGKDWQKAVTLLEECLEYPHHLGEGKLIQAQENDFYYFLGLAHEGAGHHEEALAAWKKASLGDLKPAAALYYNDAKPEKIFYQGLSLARIGQEQQSKARFEELVQYGTEHMDDHVVMDFFAVSLPDLLIWEDDLDVKNRIHCHFMMALGYYGLGDMAGALEHMSAAEALDVNHLGLAALRFMHETLD